MPSSNDLLETINDLQKKQAAKEKDLEKATILKAKLEAQQELLNERLATEFNGLDDWDKAKELAELLRTKAQTLTDEAVAAFEATQ